MRERGLKLVTVELPTVTPESLPMRERGLKRAEPFPVEIMINVAPHAGAWIETW